MFASLDLYVAMRESILAHASDDGLNNQRSGKWGILLYDSQALDGDKGNHVIPELLESILRAEASSFSIHCTIFTTILPLHESFEYVY